MKPSERKEGKRSRLMSEQNGLCPYCGEQLLFLKKGDRNFGNSYLKPTVDHIIPLDRGGANCEQNMVLVHARCNYIKGNFTPEECLRFLKNMKISFSRKPGMLRPENWGISPPWRKNPLA